jgi:hypothetical protein
MAEPLSFAVMIGRAILRLVASRAAASVTIHIETKARRKLRVGLKGGAPALSRGVGEGAACRTCSWEVIEFILLEEWREDVSSISLGGGDRDMLSEKCGRGEPKLDIELIWKT